MVLKYIPRFVITYSYMVERWLWWDNFPGEIFLPESFWKISKNFTYELSSPNLMFETIEIF